MFFEALYIKKLTFFLGALLTIGLFLAPALSAQNTQEICGGANLSFRQDAQGCDKVQNSDGSWRDMTEAERREQGSSSKVNSLIDDIINIFSIIVGIVAVIMIIYGGFRFITSGGDSAKVASSRNTILYAIVGLVIVAFAQFIVKFVLAKLAGQND